MIAQQIAQHPGETELALHGTAQVAAKQEFCTALVLFPTNTNSGTRFALDTAMGALRATERQEIQ